MSVISTLVFGALFVLVHIWAFFGVMKDLSGRRK